MHFYKNTIGKYWIFWLLLYGRSTSNSSLYEAWLARDLPRISTHLGNLLKMRVDWKDLALFNNSVCIRNWGVQE